MAFIIDPNLPQAYTGFARSEPLATLNYNSFNQENPRLKRLRAEEFNTSMGAAAGFSIAGTALSAFDSIVESLGITEQDTLEEYLADVYPEFGNFFLRHRDNFQVAGDIASAVLLGGAGAAAVRTTGVLGKAVTRTFGSKATPFLSSGKTAQQLSKQAVDRAQFIIGTRPQARNLDVDKAFRQAKSHVARRRLADFAIEAVAAETAIAAGLHGSEFLFPEEMSLVDNLVWIGGTNLIIGAGFYAHGWRTVRKMSQDVAGKLKGKSTNPDELPLTDLPANMYAGQGPAMSVLGQLLDTISRQKIEQAVDPEDLANIANAQTSVRERITSFAEDAAHGRPIDAINDAFDLTPDQARAIGDAVQKNPEIFAALQSLEDFDVGRVAAESSSAKRPLAYQQNKIDAYIATLNDETAKKAHRVRDITAASAVRNNQGQIVAHDDDKLSIYQLKLRRDLMDEMHQLQQQIEGMRRLIPTTVELDGTMTLGANRPLIYQDGERVITSPPRGEGESKVFRAEVGETALEANVAGRLKSPSTFCPLNRAKKLRILPKIQNYVGAVGAHFTSATLVNQGLESLEDLRKSIDSGVPTLWNEEVSVTSLRESLRMDPTVPDQFMAFGKGQATGHLKFNQGRAEGYSRPVVVSVDDIVAIGDKGDLYVDLPEYQNMTSATWSLLDHQQRTATWDLLQKQLEEKSVNPFEVLRDSERATHHTQLDYIAELAESRGLPQEEVGYKDLWYRSLSSKFTDYQQMREVADQAEHLGKRHDYQDKRNVAVALNIDPESPVMDIFDRLRVEGQTMKLADTHNSMEVFMREVQQQLSIQEPLPPRSFRGSMLNMARDKKPAAALIDSSITLDDDIRQGLVDLVAQRKSEFKDALMRGKTPIVSGVTRFLDQNPDMVKTIKQGIQELIQGTQMYNPVGRRVVQQNFALRDQPGMEALDAAIDNILKIENKAIERAWQQPTEWVKNARDTAIHTRTAQPEYYTRQEVLNQLLRSNAGSATGLDLFHVFRAARAQGWNLNDTMLREVELPSGGVGYQFSIADDEGNRQLWERLNPNNPMGDEQLLTVPGKPGTPLTLNEEAFRAVRVTGEIMGELLDEVNTLRSAQGKQPLKKKTFWMPPAALDKKELVYLLNESGKVERIVSDLTVSGADSRAQKEIAIAAKTGRTLVPLSHESIQRYRLASLEAVFDSQNYSSSIRQTGEATGKTASEVFDTGARPYQQMQEGMLRAFSDLGRQLRYEIFDSELQYLKLEHGATGAGPKQETIFSFAANRIAGTQLLDPETFVGRGHLLVTSGYDAVMTKLADKLNPLAEKRQERNAIGIVRRLDSELGKDFNPFESGLDYAERTHKAVIPPTLRKHAALLSKVVADASIRVMDIGMGVVNLASLAVTLPPVVRMSLPKRGEPVEHWQSRVAAFGGVTPEKGLPWLSPTKIMVNGLRWSFTQEAKAVRDIALSRGYMDQYAAEAVGTFDNAGQTFVTRLVRDTIDKASVITDKTERLARGISWMAFYNLGNKGFGLDTEAAMVFAHKQANNVIADFRPSNRPDIFQGASGMPLSLFTTYMWNFLQRIYRTIETGDKAAIATQAALQQSLFGLNSMPGAQAYIQALGANEDGTVNIEDRIGQALGRNLTDVIMHGTIGTVLPRSLGLGGGIDIGSRAGIGLPFSRVLTGDLIGEPSTVWENLWKAAPGLQFAGRLWDTGQRMAERAIVERGFDFGDAAEILAASNINKGITNAIEVAQGYAVDHADQIIEEDTRTRIGIASRLAGLKPLKTTQTQAAARRINNTDKIQGAMKQKLSDWMRTELRKGTLTTDKLDMALGDYMKAGGSPKNFRDWYLSQIRRGTTNKLDMALAEAVRSNDADSRVARLMFIMQDEY